MNAHFISGRLPLRVQIAVHLLLPPLLLLPLGVPPGWSPPAEGSPTAALLGLRALTVGLPFTVVSTSGPLGQRWFSRSGHLPARDPYVLYAASNLRSLLALLGWPLLFERHLRLGQQAALRAMGYKVLVLLLCACSIMVLRRPGAPEPAPADAPAARLGWPRRARWLTLALPPSSLMLGATTHVTTDLAAVPLLWVLPLGAYPLSVVTVFARQPRRSSCSPRRSAVTGPWPRTGPRRAT